MSDISNSNKRLHQNFHEMCVWIPSLCSHLEALEVISGADPTDLKQKGERSEIIEMGIGELKRIIPGLYGVAIINQFSAEFDQISELLDELDDYWINKKITMAYVNANKIDKILLEIRPYISEEFANQVPRRLTILQAGLELLGGKTRVVGQTLAKYLDICAKKRTKKKLKQNEQDEFDGLQDEILHEWNNLKAALAVYRKASSSWSNEAQQLLIRIHSQHTEFAEAWKIRETWSALDCQKAQLVYYNFQMAIAAFITQPREWRVASGSRAWWNLEPGDRKTGRTMPKKTSGASGAAVVADKKTLSVKRLDLVLETNSSKASPLIAPRNSISMMRGSDSHENADSYTDGRSQFDRKGL